MVVNMLIAVNTKSVIEHRLKPIARANMKTFEQECMQIISEVQQLLSDNPEWIDRYAGYANAIEANLHKIISMKKRFNEWSPLYLYTNVSKAKGDMSFSLRYQGQEVATLKAGSKQIRISTKKFDEKNQRDFQCDPLSDTDWRSAAATKFRQHFSTFPKRTNQSGKKNEEHRIESTLLSEFSKRRSKNKILTNIQPVKIADIARFQMPTPISGSDINKLKYSGRSGGGIDILSRIGAGNATKLCIMEVKDENVTKEPPTKAIKQALTYATFIRELLKSRSGEQWWKLFGFNRKRPDSLALGVACVMPSNQNDDTSFGGMKIEAEKDVFSLHYLYFEEKECRIKDIKSSLS